MTNQNSDDLFCDTCGVTTDNPWHSSRLNNRHYHECDLCHDKEIMNNTKMTTQNSDDLFCDTCGATTDNPWHSSRLNNRHYHECDLCHDKEIMNNTKMNINLLEQECTVNEFTQPWPLIDTQKMCAIIVDKCVELCLEENSKTAIIDYFKKTL